MILIKRLCSHPEFVPLTRFALDVKEKTLPLYEKMFDVEYPLPKLDTLVASDFDAGKTTFLLLETSTFLSMPLKVQWRTG